MAPNKPTMASESPQMTCHQNAGHTNYICSICVPKRDINTTSYTYMSSDECKNHGKQVHNLVSKDLGEFVHNSFWETHFMLGAPKKVPINGQGRTNLLKRNYTRRKNVIADKTAATTFKHQCVNTHAETRDMSDNEDASANSNDEDESRSDSDSFTASQTTVSPVNVRKINFDSQMTAPHFNTGCYEFDNSQLLYGAQMEAMPANSAGMDSQAAFLKDNPMSNWFLESNSCGSYYPSTTYGHEENGLCGFPIDPIDYCNDLSYMDSSILKDSQIHTDHPDYFKIGSSQPSGQSLRINLSNAASSFTHGASASPVTGLLTHEGAPVMGTSAVSANSGFSFGSSPDYGSQTEFLTKSFQSYSLPTSDNSFIHDTPQNESIYDQNSLPQSFSVFPVSNQESANPSQRQRLSENPQFESAISAGGDAIRAAGEARLAQSRAQQAAGIPRKLRNNGTMGIPLTAKNYAAAGMPQNTLPKARRNAKSASARNNTGVQKNALNSRRRKSVSKTPTLNVDMFKSDFNVVQTPVVNVSGGALINSSLPLTVVRKPRGRSLKVKTNGLCSGNTVLSRSGFDGTPSMIDARGISQISALEFSDDCAKLTTNINEHNLGGLEVDLSNFEPSHGSYVSPYKQLSQTQTRSPIISSIVQSTTVDQQLPDDFDFQKYFESHEAMNPDTGASIWNSIDGATELPPLPFDSNNNMDPLIIESSNKAFLSTLSSHPSPLGRDDQSIERTSQVPVNTPASPSAISELMATIKQQQEQANTRDAELLVLKSKLEKEKVEAEMQTAAAARKMIELQEINAELLMEKSELERKGKAAALIAEGRAGHGLGGSDVIVAASLSSAPSIPLISPVNPTSTASKSITPPFAISDEPVFNGEFFEIAANACEAQGNGYGTWTEFDSGTDFSLFNTQRHD